MNKSLLVLTLFFSTASFAVENVTLDGKKFRQIATKEDIPVADALYNNKQYKQAFALYQSLAFNGEKFSQYMLSTMYLEGLGVEKDPLMAYAWAYNAKEDGNPKLRSYFDSIESSLSSEQLNKADKLRMEVFAQYGNFALAHNMKRWIKKSLPLCTGSRIRGNAAACAQVRVSCKELKEGEFSATHNYGEDCKQSINYSSPDHIASLKTELKGIKKYIKTQTGKVSVERVE